MLRSHKPHGIYSPPLVWHQSGLRCQRASEQTAGRVFSGKVHWGHCRQASARHLIHIYSAAKCFISKTLLSLSFWPQFEHALPTWPVLQFQDGFGQLHVVEVVKEEMEHGRSVLPFNAEIFTRQNLEGRSILFSFLFALQPGIARRVRRMRMERHSSTVQGGGE